MNAKVKFSPSGKLVALYGLGGGSVQFVGNGIWKEVRFPRLLFKA